MSTREVFEFRKSSYSGSQGECIEVARNLHSVVGVRDSMNPYGPSLVFPAQAWAAFVTAIKAGDLPAR